jgi:hypothetical protein
VKHWLAMFLCCVSARAALLEGPPGLAFQVSKYLLDRGVDPDAARLAGQLSIVARGGVEQVDVWKVAAVLPSLDQLEPVDVAQQVLAASADKRVYEEGRWRLKTAAELDASPENQRQRQLEMSKMEFKRDARAAGFGADHYTAAEALSWILQLPSEQQGSLLKQLNSVMALGGGSGDIGVGAP